jgi:hypothetical protein
MNDSLPGTLSIGQPSIGTGNPSGTQGGAVVPGPLGANDAIPLGSERIIAKVTKDWDPPDPRTTPEIVVGGKTLADAGRELDQLREWGEGGGSLRSERIPAGTSTNLTVELKGNLVRRLPRWTGYDSASPAAKKEWDRMLPKLQAHEDRHMQIAIEEGDRLAADLVGREIGEIAGMVTAANRRMQRRQNELDADTQNGSKAGVQYGDVILDTSVR